MKEHSVVYEWSGRNWSPYCPDIPGCAATVRTREECERSYQEALAIWMEETRAAGLPIPEPRAEVGKVSLAAR